LPAKRQIARQKQTRYLRQRKKCRPHKIFENADLFAVVKKLFLGCQWSPEKIAVRLKLEGYPIQPSYKTIYRAIYAVRYAGATPFRGQSRCKTQTSASRQTTPP